MVAFAVGGEGRGSRSSGSIRCRGRVTGSPIIKIVLAEAQHLSPDRAKKLPFLGDPYVVEGLSGFVVCGPQVNTQGSVLDILCFLQSKTCCKLLLGGSWVGKGLGFGTQHLRFRAKNSGFGV